MSLKLKFTVSILLLILMFIVSLSLGAVKIPFSEILSLKIKVNDLDIVKNIRLPRTLLALTVGAALGVSGVAIQSIFRYPIADPSIIGVSSGAALFVALYIVFFEHLLHMGIWGYCIAAFLGGVIATLLLFGIAGRSLNSSTQMVLAGLAISFFASSIIGFLLYTSNDQQLRNFTFWTLGSLANYNWLSVFAAVAMTFVGIVVLWIFSPALNIISLGIEEAASLGVNVKTVSIIVISSVALMVGSAVAVSGIIAFLGLIVPHLCRYLFSNDHKILIPASAICGAMILVVSDTIARIAIIPSELPVGILTSFIGAAAFLWIILTKRAGSGL